MGSFKEMDRAKARAHIQVVRDPAKLFKLPREAWAGGGEQYLRRDAAHALAQLRAEASKAGLSLKVASAWRRRQWATRADYEADMVRRYGSVAKGQRMVAWDSYHHRAMAVGFGSDGLAPKSATIDQQRKTKAYAWLTANAARFGFYPYSVEPWHWEFRPQGIPAAPPSKIWQQGEGSTTGWIIGGVMVAGLAALWASDGDPAQLVHEARRLLHSPTKARGVS